MTVTYTHKVANARLGGFSSLLIRWKGSVYKLFYREFFIYIALYTLLSVLYRFVLHGSSKVYFEKLCIQFHHYTDLIPISFVLGFYVSIVVGRWWSQFENIPWPDRLMIIIGSNVHGVDDRGRLLRRTLVRYLNLAQVLTYRSVSTAVYKRFPTIRHVVNAGIMTENEYEQFENAKSANLKYWIPILWFSNLLTKVRQEGRIYDDMTFNLIITELNTFRSCCGQLINYDWISVPLVYTQVVTVAVYMFFMSTLLSRQFLDTEQKYNGHEVDLYVPLFTIGQFFFYMGWLKVAEQLINPFGEDDDDFEVNWCIDRNVEVSMLAVDKLYGKHPKLEKDKFWNDFNPVLPYTAASVSHKIEPFMGSTFDMSISKDEMQLANNINNEVRRNKSTLRISNKESSSVNGNLLRVPQLGRMTQNKHPTTSDASLLLFSGQKRESNDTTPVASSDDDSSDDDSHHIVIQTQQKHINANSEEPNKLFDSDVENNNVKAMTASEVILKHECRDTSISQLPAEEMEANSKLFTNTSIEEPESPLFVRRSHESSCKNKTGGLRLDLSTISHQRYLESGLRQNDDTMEERKNAEKRTYLASRRRKFRNVIPPRKRTRRSESGYSLWLRRQQRRLSEVRSGGGDAVFSESDIGSGPATDSPFGSMMSCATSIPSPKQLRWAFRSKAVNVYGDNTSVTSSVPSPSGTEGFPTDSATTPPLGMPWLSKRSDYRPNQSKPLLVDNPSLAIKRSTSHPSSGREETITPFTDDLRKRLQVVSLSSPTPTSPFSDRHQKPTSHSSSSSSSKAQSVSKTKTMKRHAVVLRKQLKEFKAGKSQKYQNSSEKLPRLSVPVCDNFDDKHPPLKNNNLTLEQGPLLFQSSHQPIPSSVPSVMRRNGSGIWNALKTWKTKKREMKARNRDEFVLLPKSKQQELSIENSSRTNNSQIGKTSLGVPAVQNPAEFKTSFKNCVVTGVDNVVSLSKENAICAQSTEGSTISENLSCLNHSLQHRPEVFKWENEQQDCAFRNERKLPRLVAPHHLGSDRAISSNDDDEIIRNETNFCKSTSDPTTAEEKFSVALEKSNVQLTLLQSQTREGDPDVKPDADVSDESNINKNISKQSVILLSPQTPQPIKDAPAEDTVATNVFKTASGTFCDSSDHTSPSEKVETFDNWTQSSVLIINETAGRLDQKPHPSASFSQSKNSQTVQDSNMNSSLESCSEPDTFGLAIIPELTSDDEKSTISSSDLDKTEIV